MVLVYKTIKKLYDLYLRPYIEQGKAFSSSKRVFIASDASEYFYFENPQDNYKTAYIATIVVGGKAEADIDIYENITVINKGTPMRIRNLNLGSRNVATCKTYYGGSFSGLTEDNSVHQTVLPGGSKIRAIGHLAEVGEAVIIPPGKSILVVLTNTSADMSKYSVRFLWYEP